MADKIGARDGQVLKENFMGGLLVPYGLGFTIIRPGPADEVAQAQIDAAVAAGYTDPPLPPCDSKTPCGFTRPQDMPLLRIETFPAGSTFRATDIVVPAGHTGVIIHIG